LSTDCPAEDQFIYGSIDQKAPLTDIPSTANSQDYLPLEFGINPDSEFDLGVFDSFSEPFLDNFGDTPHIPRLQDNYLASLAPIPFQDPISSNPNSNASTSFTTSRSTSTSSPGHGGHAKRQKLLHKHVALPLPIMCEYEGCKKQFDRECDYQYVLSQRVKVLTNYSVAIPRLITETSSAHTTDATIGPIDKLISIDTSNKCILEGGQTHAPHVDVDSDDEKILEGMSRVVLTLDDMVESIFQGNELRTALDLDPVTTLVGVWAEPFHKTTDLTENDCLGEALENIHFSSETENSTDAQMRTCQPAPPSSSCDSYEYGESMLLQPETGPISQEQLVNEVKGIYAGLVVVEKYCVDICRTQVPHKRIRSKREQELRFDDFFSIFLRDPSVWLLELAFNVHFVITAQEFTIWSLADLGIVAVEDICILDQQRSVYLRRIWSLLHRLCDIDNRYERMFDSYPLMNERCFSADCPCWCHSSILVRYPWLFLGLGWIGTQLSITSPLRLDWHPALEFAVYVLYPEAHV
jgi:hypothetical protein